MSEQYLLLKWGTLKGWNVEGNENAMDAIRKYYEASEVSPSAMLQHDTEEQKQALCDLVDSMPGDAVIQNDWSGEKYSKEEAREYIRCYGKRAPVDESVPDNS